VTFAEILNNFTLFIQTNENIFVAKPGDKFQYASATTQLLVYLAEPVEKKRWSEIFNERIWSKISADAPIQLLMTPDVK